jgi:hypothetical protein
MRFKRLCLLFERSWLPPVPMLPVIKLWSTKFSNLFIQEAEPPGTHSQAEPGNESRGRAWKIKKITPVNAYNNSNLQLI